MKRRMDRNEMEKQTKYLKIILLAGLLLCPSLAKIIEPNLEPPIVKQEERQVLPALESNEYVSIQELKSNPKRFRILLTDQDHHLYLDLYSIKELKKDENEVVLAVRPVSDFYEKHLIHVNKLEIHYNMKNREGITFHDKNSYFYQYDGTYVDKVEHEPIVHEIPLMTVGSAYADACFARYYGEPFLKQEHQIIQGIKYDLNRLLK